jgi:TolB-like protein
MSLDTKNGEYRFGGLTLDLARGTIRRGVESIFLRPKAFAVLALLAQNIGGVVPKAQLLDEVWPGVFVTEDSLTQAIREIRKALGEQVVRTVSKRGYMLVPEVEPEDPTPTQSVVAVLRFRNESGNADDDAIVDGFAAEIIDSLSRFGSLTTLARNSSFAFPSYDVSRWDEIRSRIGANYVVEGSVRRQGDRFMMAVSLSEAQGGVQLWAERYQAQDTGIFAIERDIVEQVVGRLVARVSSTDLQRAQRKPASSLAAYELMLRGAALLFDPAQSDLIGAAALLRSAIAKDPAYGIAHTYLALSYALEAEFGPVSTETLIEARDIADKGASLSPNVAVCRGVQALVRVYLQQHESAEHYQRLSLQLNPNEVECVGQMGFLQLMRGRPVEALNWLARALRIDPLKPYWYQYDRSMALYLLGEYGAAAEALEQSTRPTPWISTRLAACYAQLGDMAKAKEQAARIATAGSNFSPLDYATRGLPFERPADAQHFAEGVFLALGVDPGRIGDRRQR